MAPHRGSEGGCFLARPLGIDHRGGSAAVSTCSPTNPKGSKRPGPFNELWHNVDKSIAGIVDRTNFASILRDWKAKQSTYVHDWEI